MKRFFFLLFILVIALLSFTACSKKGSPIGSSVGTTNSTPPTEAATVTTSPEDTYLVIVKDEKSDFIMYRSETDAGSYDLDAASGLKKAIKDSTNCNLKYTTDFVKKGTDMSIFNGLSEILIGRTNRKESESVLATLKGTEFAVKVVDNKLVIVGTSSRGTLQGASWFINNYVSEKNELVIPKSLDYKGEIDYDYCEELDMKYSEIAENVYDSFIKECFKGGEFKTQYSSAWFWDIAEMFESLIDAYEATGDEKYLKNIKTTASTIINTKGTDWSYNQYNDDIMWMCIAFSRAYLLTGERRYLTYAEYNFNTVYNRAWDSTLGGGLWWKNDDRGGKNSCVNCPAAIAACYIAKGTGDDKYYETAKKIMEWEIKTLYNKDGAVDDCILTSGDKNYYHSTYNQGTFIGACMLLHEKYGDAKYMEYAESAANYTVERLTTGGILDNGENGQDLMGFKGIFVRWFYRYAKYTSDLDKLDFLQKNATVAYTNRNSKGLIWTNWKEKTSNDISGYHVFGLSTAVSLVFNSLDWKK